MFKTQPLSQRDPRWADVPLGFSTQGSTIGMHGCLLVCITMIANGSGFVETPVTLNEKLKALGPDAGYTGDTGNRLVWAGIQGALKTLMLNDVDYCATGAPIARINAELNMGVPCIVKLDSSQAPGLQEHWVVIYEQRGDDYGIYDPWPKPEQGNDRSLLTEYGFAGDASSVIRTVVWLSGRANETPAKLVVRVMEEWRKSGLRMYRSPSLDGAVIKRLPDAAELLVLEDPAIAIQKIGAQDKWVWAKDIEGSIGYVPAWHVFQRVWSSKVDLQIGAFSVLSGRPPTKKAKKKAKKAAKKKSKA